MTTTSQSWPVRPRSAGRAIASSTTALVASRSHTIVVGETSSNSVFAMPAPNWTDRIPKSTSQMGESREVRTDESRAATGSTYRRASPSR